MLRCTNGGFVTRVMYLVFFPVPAKVLVILADVTVAEGSNVTLPCTAEGYPTPHVAWIAPNGTVLQNRTTDTNLTVTDVTHRNNGTYQCVASNDLESSSVKVNLIVFCKYT